MWSGILFVREGMCNLAMPLTLKDADRYSGPYSSAVLRFEISFPDRYPELPPLIIFTSDIFHPLLVPLTTYTFSTSLPDASGTVSASDEDRLPPGAFSLRYGFPHWFARQKSKSGRGDPFLRTAVDERPHTAAVASDDRENLQPLELDTARAVIVQVLKHIKAAFEDAALLDRLPLEAAGNPSAWHAWRAHRGLVKPQPRARSPANGSADEPPASPKHPGEWNWEGVWESRVSDGIDASISEASLFGSSGIRTGSAPVEQVGSHGHHVVRRTEADRQIRFSNLSDDRLEELQQVLQRA